MILIWFKSDLMILCQLCYFQDNVHAPVSKAILEVKSRTLGISKAWLRLHAHFRGLRYLMYHYPLTSGIVGITSISIFLFSMLLLAFSKVVDPIQVKCFYPRCYVRTTPRGSKFCFVVVVVVVVVVVLGAETLIRILSENCIIVPMHCIALHCIASNTTHAARSVLALMVTSTLT
jgi:hypothetical protein